MSKTKMTFEKFADTQRHLIQTLSDNSVALAEVVGFDKKSLEKTQEIAREFAEKQRVLFEEASRPVSFEKPFESMLSGMTKAVQMQADLYGRTFELYRNVWTEALNQPGEERMKKVAELYRTSLDAMWHAANANNELVSNFWKD